MERNRTASLNDGRLVLATFVALAFAACSSNSNLSKDGGAGVAGVGGHAGSSPAGADGGDAAGGNTAGQTGADGPVESSAGGPADAPVDQMQMPLNMCVNSVPLPDGGVSDPVEVAPGFTCAPIFMVQQTAMPPGAMGIGQGSCGGYRVWVGKGPMGTLVCIYDATPMTVPPERLVGILAVTGQQTICVGDAYRLPMSCADPATYVPPTPPKSDGGYVPDGGYADGLAPTDAAPDPTLETSLKNGIVALWPLDGDGKDHSGNGLDLTITGVSFVPTRFGSGLSFNGDLMKTAKRPIADPSLVLERSDFTISLWVNLDPDHHISQGILDNGAAAGGAWGFGTPSGAPQPPQDQLWIMFTESGTLYGPDPDKSLGPEWHHMIAERSGSQLTIYSANAVVGMAQVATSFQNPAPDPRTVQLGTWAGGTALPLFGALDDVAIWNRALTPDERAYLDQHPVPRVVP
jgi:hypothetical protein